MPATQPSTCPNHGWLDHFAIGMAVVCAVHCLLMPILIIALPIIATSFFVHKDFHLWMILLVLPTTTFAVFMGCRKHKDRWVAVMSAVGLSILIFALVEERMQHSMYGAEAIHADSCEFCSRGLAEEGIPMHAGAWFNTVGGLFLAAAHIRNFRLCRKSHCCH